MSEDDLKKQIADLTTKMTGLAEKNTDLETKLSDQLSAKTDVIKQRDELKSLIKTLEGGKKTEDATVEQLKELLKESTDKLDNVEKGRKEDKLEAKLIEAAMNAGFVKNKAGKINAKILKSEIDIGKLHLDDDGEIIGLTSIFDKIRENSSYLFEKKKAASKDINVDPESKKGEDLSNDALANETDFHKRRAIIAKRGKKFLEESKNGLPSGMGQKTGPAPENDAGGETQT